LRRFFVFEAIFVNIYQLPAPKKLLTKKIRGASFKTKYIDIQLYYFKKEKEKCLYQKFLFFSRFSFFFSKALISQKKRLFCYNLLISTEENEGEHFLK